MTPQFGSLTSTLDLSPQTRLPNSSDHFVEFYEDDSILTQSLHRFFSVGLSKGEASIVVATCDHMKALEESLAGDGLDLQAARETNLFTAMDAADTLAVFMEDGVPNPEVFAEVLGNVIDRASAGNRKVRIFGEMVALLWSKGNVTGALRLEDLWNSLAESRHFKLFCAYPTESFRGRNLAPLRSVCHRHTHVIAAEQTAI